MTILRILGVVLEVILVLAVVAIILVVLLARGLSKDNDKRLRDKFGDNYDKAITDELTPLECKPSPNMVSEKTIREMTGLSFPEFKIMSCVSLLRHFTGDYHERCEIQFCEPFEPETVKTIHESESWKNQPDGTYSFSSENQESRSFWSMTVSPEGEKASIDYGGF